MEKVSKNPIVIGKDLSQSSRLRWEKQFVNTGRNIFESIWRRTQDQNNSKDSGWKDVNDKRRRIVHFFDKYELKSKNNGLFDLIVTKPYLWLHLTLLKSEINKYEKKALKHLKKYGWIKVVENPNHKIYEKDNIQIAIKSFSKHKEDFLTERIFPTNYKILEFTFKDKSVKLSKKITHKPWEVLVSGIREKDKRGEPKLLTNMNELIKYLPAQVELGCGPSIDAGIPPLFYLHRVYCVNNPKTHTFVFGVKDDKLMFEMIADYHKFYAKAGRMYLKSITSKITIFHKLLKQLHTKNIVVGPIITNNFDGLTDLIGLPELYVRKYDEAHIVPNIKFHPKAKSLIVIGSHADRRKIQKAARLKGLKVIYVDPEGYKKNDGSFLKHELESCQSEDYLYRGTSLDFAKDWIKSNLPR